MVDWAKFFKPAVTRRERAFMALWLAGLIVWVAAEAWLLFYQEHRVSTFAEATALQSRFSVVLGAGTAWFMAGLVWQQRLKKRD